MAHSHRIAVLFVLALLALATASSAQIPDTFTNLQVLPKDIKKPDLVRTMREFSNALGVRCIHCHVGDNPADLSTVDFAADDRDTKKIAREMMKMTRDLNTTLTTAIGTMRPELLAVGCFTCHHGNARPETLEQALVAELKAGGVDSTVVKYRRLRDRYYGSAAYDFGEWSLISVAEKLAREPAHGDAALALLRTNLEFYPESAGTYARIGETYLAHADTASALTYFDRALALAPDDPWLARRVEALKGNKK